MKAKTFIKKTKFNWDKRVDKNPPWFTMEDMIRFAEMYHKNEIENSKKIKNHE